MSHSPPLITVIIPHLNQPDALRRCLQSLAEQCEAPSSVEFIVVDNGSQHLPSEVVDDFEGVTLEREEAAGPGPARNRGVTVSRGEVLAFIDADCIADRHWISSIVGAFPDAEGNEIVGGDVRIAVTDPKRLTTLEAYESIFAYRQEEYITRHGFSGTGNLAVRRTVFDAIGPFAGIHLAEDRDWGQRATELGYTTEYVPEMIVYHPARRTFAELFQKWDRHIDHDFEEWSQQRFARLRWAVRSIAVAASPIFEVGRIVSSKRVAGFRSRLLAVSGMTTIRLYRTLRMLTKLLTGSSANQVTWNRL